MCGIAGYNISPEAAEEFGNDRFGRILTGIWERNIHRGTDAHGYMASRLRSLEPELEQDGVWTYKTQGSAMATIENGTYSKHFKPVSLGIHTRMSTTGHESKNENNHPVQSGNVWVTHNGMVDPLHHYFTDKDKYPEVDSYYIAHVLNAIKEDITDIDVFEKMVADIEREISGGFAFHAMWANYPGLSLIVRGNSNPLVTAYNEDRGVFLYASEDDAVAFMMEKFNLPKKGTIIGQPEQGTAILMYLGEIINYGSFQPQSRDYYWGNNTHRMPKRDLWRVSETYDLLCDLSNDVDYSYATPRSLFETTPQQKDDVWDLTNPNLPAWFTNAKKTQNRIALWHGWFDQGFAYLPNWVKTPTSMQIRFFMMKDNTEFIFNEDFELLDIVEWEKFSDFSPWCEFEISPNKSDVDVGNVDFQEWWGSRLSKFEIKDLWHQPERVDVDLKALPVATGGYTTDGVRRFRLLDYEANRNELIRHMREHMIVTIGDPECALHNQRFSVHTRPYKCPTLLNAARMVLCSARNLGDLVAMYDVEVKIEGGQDDCSHEWKSIAFKPIAIDVYLEGDEFGENYHYPVSDECVKCEAQMHLKKFSNFTELERKLVKA